MLGRVMCVNCGIALKACLLTSTQPEVSAGEAQTHDACPKGRRGDATAAPADGAALMDVEREAILGAVRRANGNLAEAARLPRVSRSTL